MKEHEGDNKTVSTDSLIVEIVDILEEHGIDQEMYTLHDYIDLDALEELIYSEDASIEVRLTIEGVQLSITPHGVQALNGLSNTCKSSS